MYIQKWAGHVACMGLKKNVCRALLGKPEGKRSLGKSVCRWEVNINMDVKSYDGRLYILDSSGSG
jgi:hypothetical protein